MKFREHVKSAFLCNFLLNLYNFPPVNILFLGEIKYLNVRRKDNQGNWRVIIDMRNQNPN